MSNNRVLLEGCLNRFKTENEITLNDSGVFEIFSLTQITKNLGLTYENIQNSIVDGGNDGGIDSIIIMLDDEFVESLDDISDYKFSNKTTSRFIIAQCKKENSFKESPLDKIITTLPELFDLEKNERALLTRFNTELVTLASVVREVWQQTAIGGGTISVDFIYACNAPEIEVNNVFDSKTEQLKTLAKGIFSTPNVNYNNYSAAELLKLYQTHKANRLTLTFKEQPLSTGYQDHGIGYVGTVNLADYKSFLTSESGDIRDDLFESNIRHFQGAVDVNKKIKETIENISDKDFWWLNNGITIIAESPNQVGKKLTIENVQIVNGLQTSYSIFNSHKGDSFDERSVLVKVIINNNKEAIDSIIASTNSQNPVSATLLRATELTQRNLEIFFYDKGYFYDRRKNYYKNLGKPATKIFGIQYTAQAIRSIVFDDPHTARAKPTSLLKDDKVYKQIFDQKENYNGYLICCLINKKSNDLWLKISDNNSKNKTSNFKLHLAWLVPKMILKKEKVTFSEIADFDISSFDQSVYDDCLKFLLDAIDEYQESKMDANLINMAKSKDFTTHVLEKLSTLFV